MPRLVPAITGLALALALGACAPGARDALLDRVANAVDTGRAVNDAEAEVLWQGPCAASFGAAMRKTRGDPERRAAAILWCDTAPE